MVEGEHVFEVGGEEFPLGPGATVYAPRRVPHAHRRMVGRTGRFLTMVSPAGFEGFFRILAEAAATGKAAGAAYERASDEHGVTWLGDGD